MKSTSERKESLITSLEGISLLVTDVEKSVAFYSKLPGAKMIMHRTGQFAKFKVGDAHIQVVAMPPEEKSYSHRDGRPRLAGALRAPQSCRHRAGRAADEAVFRQDQFRSFPCSGREHPRVRLERSLTNPPTGSGSAFDVDGTTIVSTGRPKAESLASSGFASP